MSEQTNTDLAHELWAMAQLAPGEGIEDGAARIAERLERDKFRPLMSDQPRPTPVSDAWLSRQPPGQSVLSAHARMQIMERESDAREERLFRLSHEFGEHLYFLKAPSLPDGFRMAAERIKSSEERIRGLESLLADTSKVGAMTIGNLQTENAKLREALGDPFSLLGRIILSKVTGHVGCGEGDEWCDEVLEEAKKLGLVRWELFNPSIHGESEWVEGQDFIWWWGFLPEGWENVRPAIEFLNVNGEPETDQGKRGFLRINDRQALAGE